ncbi:MAG: glycerophosphoryl diester phosphodiesterase membrane domain-containing protein [Sphingobium sp.]
MATLSIGKAWEEAVAFVSRESALLFPVALLFVALPGLILQEMTPPELMQWTMSQARDSFPAVPPSYWLALLLTLIIIWFGSLTLFALALRPGISVGEAMRLGMARLPVLLGTALLVGAAFLALMVFVALVAAALMIASKAAAAAIGTLLVAVVVGSLLYASVRLLLLNPVVIDGQDGVVASLRRSWETTKGHFWRLLGFILIVMLLSMIASTAAQAVFGLIGGMAGGPTAARLVGGIAAAAVSTVVQVYMLVMIARLYRQADSARA